MLLIEESAQLRSGGYAIDFWGVGYGIAEKMRLLPRIRKVGYQVREVRYVNRHGRKSGGFSVDVFHRMTTAASPSCGAPTLPPEPHPAAALPDDGEEAAGCVCVVRASLFRAMDRSIAGCGLA